MQEKLEYFDVNKRIIQIMRVNGYNKNSLAKAMGMSQPTIKQIENNENLPSLKFLLEFKRLFSNINLNWLLTGEGDKEDYSDYLPKDAKANLIFNEDSGKYAVHYKSGEDEIGDKTPVPLYDINRTTSLRALFSNKPVPVDSIYIPNLPKCDGAVAMRGDWMAPLINGGDLVLYKEVRVPASREGIMDGSIYLLSFEIEDEEHIVVRYIYSTENDSIKLVGFNKTKPDKIIPINSIKAMALVKASVRYEAIA